MDVKYQVFVSSTFLDLEAERRAAIEAILNMGHIPVGMEAFQASDDTQWDYIKRRIDQSDYYIVIVGERYGSEQDGKSYTQMEYEYAVANGIPVAGFLLATEARKTWPSDKVEFEKKDKIEEFRTLCQQKLVKFWKNADELGGRVALALSELMRDKPRTGWVRADAVPSVKVMDELAALSEEKRILQAKLEQILSANSLTIPADVQIRIDALKRRRLSDVIDMLETEEPSPNLLEALLELNVVLSKDSENWEIAEALLENYPTIADGYEAVESIAVELAAHNLMDIKRFQTRQNNTAKLYTLTSYGKDLVMYAQHLANQPAPEV